MLKVECEACKAPYQVDERRVPPTGLKMRCPKCGHSFVVPSPNAPAGAAAVKPAAPVAAPPAAPALPPRPGPPLPPRPTGKQTIVGIAPPLAPAAKTAPSPVAMPVDDPFAGLGLPGEPKPPRTNAGGRQGLPAALGSLDDADYDEITDEADLPATVQKKPAPPAASKLYAMAPSEPMKQPEPAAMQEFELDLPAPVAASKGAATGAAKPAGITFDMDLPSPVADLPATKPAARSPAPRAATAPSLESPFDDLPALPGDLPALAGNLPSPQGNLPAAKRGAKSPAAGMPNLGLGDLPAVLPRDRDLPVVGGVGLPSIGSAGLPVVAGPGLPARLDAQANLPSPTSAGHNLPSPTSAGHNLPSPAALGSQLPSPTNLGHNLPAALTDERLLPTVGDVLPAKTDDSRHLPSSINPAEIDFGELELPRSNPPKTAPVEEELELSPDPSIPPAPAAPRIDGGGSAGYGEVDLGSADGDEIGALDDRVSLPTEAPISHRGPTGEAAIPSAPVDRRERPVVTRKRSLAPKIALGAVVLSILGGVALQLTPYGAFGYHAITDSLSAGEYARVANDEAKKARVALGTDLFDQATSGLDDLARAHQANPRAPALTAYAALAEYELGLRFGRDSARTGRAKSWIDELRVASPDARYLGMAVTAQKALDGDLAGARKDLEVASKRDLGDPIQQDVAMVRGEVELLAKDAAAATTAFTKAEQLAPSARTHFALARAYALAGDDDKTRAALLATLAASPGHAAALNMRARLAWEGGHNETAALQDLDDVTDGKAKAHASPADQGRAHAAKGWIHFARGRMGDARTAFEAAFKLDARNASALVGQGEVLYREGRYTEALAHFDTAVQIDPSSSRAIVSDAKTKIALERLAEAKTQLTAAHQAVPNDVHVAYWLAKAEEALGNKKAAEDDYLAAIGLVDLKADDAIAPYVALSELLAGEGRATEAQAKLDEAQHKLPDSAEMQRALGEVAAVQGLYPAAIAHYEAAVAKDPQDLSSRFLLGVTYRRMQQVDQASAAFDQVLAAEKDYPGLAMERGLLFEQSGHVDKALDQFRAALQKAPDDTDLQLRVGAAYVGVGHADDALPMLQKVLERRPNSAEANHYLGRAYFMKGGANLAQAERYLKRAVELDVNRAEYHLYLAWIANETTPPDLGLALNEVGKALAIDKLMGDAYWQRGEVERKQAAVDDAIRDLRRALELHPTRFEAHAALAECYEDKNETGLAMAEWQRAISGDDTHPVWHYRYGKQLLDRGDAGSALTHLQAAATEAEKMDPPPGWLANVEFAVAEAYRRAGRKTEAVEHYRRFLDKAPMSSPDRHDAIGALSALGQPYGAN